MEPRELRNDRDRRRPGGPDGRLLPRRRGRPFVILDANERVGDAWRKRWDSLRLFTPADFSGLPGMPIPAPSAGRSPTKDEMADYLEAYARALRAAGAERRHGRRRLEERRSVRRLGRRRAHRGRRTWSSRPARTSIPKSPAFASRARSEDRAAALQRVPQSVAASGRRRARRRRRQLGSRDRGRARRDAHVRARRAEGRRDPGSARHAAARLGFRVFRFLGAPRRDGRHPDRPKLGAKLGARRIR